MTFIDNDTRTVTEVRLGAQAIESGTSGTIYFDDFESRRFSYIGTLTDPGVDDPTATNQPGWFARTYQYSATMPHAVTSVTPETGSPDTYSYDANGNMTCRIENGVTYSQAYNAENRISSIAKRPLPALPKSDNGNFESVFKIFLVGFGEGVRRTGGVEMKNGLGRNIRETVFVFILRRLSENHPVKSPIERVSFATSNF